MTQRSDRTSARHHDRPVVAAGVTLGIGMGGFVDGIVFHEILQIHHMLSARIADTDLAGVKVNMVWDGLFNAGVWAITATGIFMLWRLSIRSDVRRSGPTFVGSLLLGWGLFNVVEGVADHHILHLHHVYERAGVSVWDWLFLAWGAVMMLVGVAGIRRDRRRG